MYLTPKQITARLPLSLSTVYQLIESGRLVAHRFGPKEGKVLVHEDDLKAYEAECRVQPSAKQCRESPRTIVPKLKHVKI